jgi:hypothetical protein
METEVLGKFIVKDFNIRFCLNYSNRTRVVHAYRQTDRQTDRQTGRQADQRMGERTEGESVFNKHSEWMQTLKQKREKDREL